MALALAKILTVTTGIDANDLSILNVTPGSQSLEAITDFLLVFLAANHLLSWLGDAQSFKAWNRPTKSVANMSMFAQRNEPISEIEYYVSQVKEYHRLQKQRHTNISLKSYRAPDEFVSELVQSSKDLQKSVDRLNLHARLYLWGWYLALPLASAAYALLL
ncbi:MAG: hypothetical protein AAFX90_12515 [Pseudomonadota bacterium]